MKHTEIHCHTLELTVQELYNLATICGEFVKRFHTAEERARWHPDQLRLAQEIANTP